MSLAVVLTRFLPFLVFSSKDHTPRFVQFLGRDLASAVFGMLVIYCLKDIDFHSPHHIVLSLYSSSSLETQHASHHCWWHHLLHDFTSMLIIFSIYRSNISIKRRNFTPEIRFQP